MDDPGASGAGASFDGLGAAGGFFQLNAGYDYQVNPWLVPGALANVDFDGTKSALNVDIPGIPLQLHGNLAMKNTWSIGGRAGYLASPGTLLFISADCTQVSMDDVKLNAGGPFPAMSAAAAVPSFGGGFIGAGAETLPAQHISLRGEYRYTSFGSGSLGLPAIEGVNLGDYVAARAAPTMQDGRVSVNYRF